MFEIYTGVDQNPPSAKGKTNDLVMRLMEQYLNVCRDSTQGPVEQAATGKVFPRNLKLTQVKRKRDKFIINNATELAMKFKDRIVFQMLSSVHSVNEVEIGCNVHGLPITKPEIVHHYNTFMEAVDWCDRVVAYSCFRRRTMKSWKEVIFYLFSSTILNA